MTGRNDREYPAELVHGELCRTRFNINAPCDCGKEPAAGSGRNENPAATVERVTFQQAVHICFAQPELMVEYRRLTGSTLGLDDRPGIVRLVDEAAGHDPWEPQWEPFFRFVRDMVWLPLLAMGAGSDV